MENINLKEGDVRLRGCYFTLYPAAEEMGINIDLMKLLLELVEDYFEEERKKDPNICKIPWKIKYTKENLTNFFYTPNMSINDFLSEGLISILPENSDMFILTDKALKCFLLAKEKREELIQKNFYFCPCREF